VALAEPVAPETVRGTTNTHNDDEKQHIRLSHVQIDVISGICAGIVSNIVSHPLDTVKVRMQIGSTESVKIVPTIKTIYHREGVSQDLLMAL
jgi:Mitochondrial carrier protein